MSIPSRSALLAFIVATLWLPMETNGQNTGAAARTFVSYLPHQSGITLTNGVGGNVCIEDDKPTAVCESAEFVDIVGNNMCQWSDDVDYPCTYYGYQFDYEGGKAGQKITCDTYRSTITIFGPKTEQVTGPMTARYTIELDADDGHIFRHAYNTYAPVQERILILDTHRCSYGGALLYEVHWIVRFTPEE